MKKGLKWVWLVVVLIALVGLFMSFFEDDSGVTIGEHMRPMLEQGRLALPKGGAS